VQKYEKKKLYQLDVLSGE